MIIIMMQEQTILVFHFALANIYRRKQLAPSLLHNRYNNKERPLEHKLTSDFFHPFQQHVFGKVGYLTGERRQAPADLTQGLAEAGADSTQPRCHGSAGGLRTKQKHSATGDKSGSGG